MKRFIILTVMLLMVFALAPTAAATPAPALSKAIILKVGPDVNYEWINVVNHAVPVERNAIYGDALYLYVRYTGYPNLGSEDFYQNGKLIARNKVRVFKYVPLTNSNGLTTGCMTTYQIPFSALSGPRSGVLGQIVIEAHGINGGSASDYVVSLRRQ